MHCDFSKVLLLNFCGEFLYEINFPIPDVAKHKSVHCMPSDKRRRLMQSSLCNILDLYSQDGRGAQLLNCWKSGLLFEICICRYDARAGILLMYAHQLLSLQSRSLKGDCISRLCIFSHKINQYHVLCDGCSTVETAAERIVSFVLSIGDAKQVIIITLMMGSGGGSNVSNAWLARNGCLLQYWWQVSPPRCTQLDSDSFLAHSEKNSEENFY